MSNHLLGHVAVQIEGHDDRRFVPDDLAGSPHDVAFDVVVAFSDSGTVKRQANGIKRSIIANSVEQTIAQALVGVACDGGRWCCIGDEDRDQLIAMPPGGFDHTALIGAYTSMEVEDFIAGKLPEVAGRCQARAERIRFVNYAAESYSHL